MFVAVILFCGVTSPLAVMGCGVSFAPKPFATEEQCMVSLATKGLPQIESQLPEGAHIADAKCFQLNVMS